MKIKKYSLGARKLVLKKKMAKMLLIRQNVRSYNNPRYVNKSELTKILCEF